MQHQIATIQVASITAPAPGKKRYKLTTSDGSVYQVAPEMCNQFQIGSSYNVAYKVDSFNGFNFNVIERSNPATGSAPAAAAPQMTHQAPAATPRNYTRQTDPDMAERIFVCGALNAALGNPNLTPQSLSENQLVTMVNGFRKVFARTFGGQPSAADEMNDEIPFDNGTGQGGYQ